MSDFIESGRDHAEELAPDDDPHWRDDEGEYDAFRDKVCNDPLWAADEIWRLQGEVARNRESANAWAYKMTLLVGWVKANCTPEQAAEARAASQP